MEQSTAVYLERPERKPEIAELSPASHSPKILVVDDDPSALRLLVDYCTRLGFHVETASNGVQALLKAGRFHPEILIIDVNMPELDGLSTCAHLLDPDRAPVEVIVITGGRNPETPERCAAFGAYCAQKGPNFWSDLEAALVDIDPRIAVKIQNFRTGGAVVEVRRRPRVLLVDDDGDVNRMLASRLAKCGIDVIYAADATQGFRMACRDEPAVIVTDYHMPNGDAMHFLSRLRTTKATGNIPVIVLSGRKLNDQINLRLRREIGGYPGAAHILCKSEDTTALFETLQKFCGFEPGSVGSTRPGHQLRLAVGPCSELAAAALGQFRAFSRRGN